MNGMFHSAREAIDWIEGARYASKKNGLENIRALLRELGDPQESFRCVHIAGTNGKGSVAAFTERSLRCAGLKTGLYTSPYLIRYNERIRVDGEQIPDGDLLEITEEIERATRPLLEKGIAPTFFELGTALAFLYFKRCQVDIAVIEVGLGGRFDATNVIMPCLSLIAAIGLDHTKLLGDTPEEIAFEKAGIIKPGIPALVQAQLAGVENVFRTEAAARGSEIGFVPFPTEHSFGPQGACFLLDGQEYRIGLAGAHQMHNAALAVRALRLLGIGEDRIREGLIKTVWPCRLEWKDGYLIDGGHNPQAAGSVLEYLRSAYPGEKVTLITGMMRDKDMRAFARTLAPVLERVIVTRVSEGRAAEQDELAGVYAPFGIPVISRGSVREAMEAAADHDGIRLISGSLYIAGEARAILGGEDCFSAEAQ